MPIFESLRRRGIEADALGLLCGSLILIPEAAVPALQAACAAANVAATLTEPPGMGGFVEVRLDGDRAVQIMTQLFTDGHLRVLVGTQALLGEGWDAPCLNALILASLVGSFMASNQMRGRAIRIDPAAPQKVANIWHLASVIEGFAWHMPDLERLERRFTAFVGLSVATPSIESGLKRLALPQPPLIMDRAAQTNALTFLGAANRDAVRRRWSERLDVATLRQTIPEVSLTRRHLPRPYVFASSVRAVLLSLIGSGTLLAFSALPYAISTGRLWGLPLALLGGCVWAAWRYGPASLRAIALAWRGGSLHGRVDQVAQAVLTALRAAGLLTARTATPLIDRGLDGQITCALSGGSVYEKTLFLDALEDVLNPIENPRYLIVRQGRWRAGDADYHAVPTILSNNKERADVFAQSWRRHVGAMDLVFTRSAKGRAHLLHARKRAVTNQLRQIEDRIARWR